MDRNFTDRKKRKKIEARGAGASGLYVCFAEEREYNYSIID